MKQLILTILLVILSAPVCFGEWTGVASSLLSGDTYYVDFERIREHSGHVYFWELKNHSTRDKYEDMSVKAYTQVDCDQFRSKVLSIVFYKQPMGKGGTVGSDNTPSENWTYPPPDTVAEGILEAVCKYVSKKNKE